MLDQSRAIADAAWRSMQEFDVPPTPRNYEIWFTFCRGDKPGLNERLDAVLLSGQPLTAGFLDECYREMFVPTSGFEAARDGSCELQKVANELVERVVTDREVIDSLGANLDGLSDLLRPQPSVSDLRSATATLIGASTKVSKRLKALETLLTASIQRITDLKAKLAQAEEHASRDALTGLKNRRYFDATLFRATKQAYQENSTVSLLLFDIDHFKRVNDNFGHTVGDNVLRLVARALLEHFKGRDTVARYGGEEFAMILPNTTLADGYVVAEQLRVLLEHRRIAIRAVGQDLGALTCSIGVAEYRHGELVGDFVDRVDRALYRAKGEGRNRVSVEVPAESLRPAVSPGGAA